MRVVRYLIAIAIGICIPGSILARHVLVHDTLQFRNTTDTIIDSTKIIARSILKGKDSVKIVLKNSVNELDTLKNSINKIKGKITHDTIPKRPGNITGKPKIEIDSIKNASKQVSKQITQNADSLLKTTSKDFKERIDTLGKSIKELPQKTLYNVKQQAKGKVDNIKSLPKRLIGSKDSLHAPMVTVPKLSIPKFGKPLLNITGGRVDYNFFYRSNIDTPFIEKNVYQHQVNGSVNFTIGNLIPIIVNTQVRRSNSLLFRDITDVQVQYDAQSFQRGLYSNAMSGLKQAAWSLKDSVAGNLADLKLLEFNQFQNLFQSRFTIQQLVEANEVINVPGLSVDKTLPDSLATKKSDSIQNSARQYIKDYNEAKESIAKTKNTADSLKAIYDKSLSEVKKVQDLANGKINNYSQYKDFENNNSIGLVPRKYRWLLGIRKFSLGRSPVNYSELTAKNISLNGINFEYNSWYYVSVSAGLVDFRFRDFVINGSKKPKQYFYMARLGIGSLEKDYIIFSIFKGQKKIFAAGNINDFYSFTATGASLEAKYQFTKNIYLKAEIGESLAPDFRTNPAKYNSWNVKDKNDKAYSLSSGISLPRSKTKIEAYYKYSGANYQCFSTFQTNSSLIAWRVKADQYLFKRKLRITAAIKENEFSNPYILQAYRSNIVYKSLQLAFRKKGWPVISAGYMPMSQLTDINGTIYENQFNSLNATIYHTYKLGNVKASTAVTYTKFYNAHQDSGFIYFNAQNIFFNQVMYLTFYTASVNVTHSTNKDYEFSIIEGSLKWPIRKILVISIGAKVCNLNQFQTSTGGSFSLQYTSRKNTSISIQYENGYLPGVKGTLVKNIIGNVQLSKRF